MKFPVQLFSHELQIYATNVTVYPDPQFEVRLCNILTSVVVADVYFHHKRWIIATSTLSSSHPKLVNLTVRNSSTRSGCRNEPIGCFDHYAGVSLTFFIRLCGFFHPH